MNRSLLVLSVLTLAACGYTDAGSGTGTLFVTASASYNVDGSETQLEVSVTRAGLAVDDATVNLRDASSDELLPVPHSGPGTYTLRVDGNGYHRRLALEVQAPSATGGVVDSLRAKLEGPSPHVIVNPKAGGLTRGSQGATLDVEWACNDGIGADEVQVVIGDAHFTKVVASDSGKTDGPAMAALSSGSHGLRVTRLNTVDLKGGVTGSVFTSSFTVRSNFSIID